MWLTDRADPLTRAVLLVEAALFGLALAAVFGRLSRPVRWLARGPGCRQPGGRPGRRDRGRVGTPGGRLPACPARRAIWEVHPTDGADGTGAHRGEPRAGRRRHPGFASARSRRVAVRGIRRVQPAPRYPTSPPHFPAGRRQRGLLSFLLPA